MMSGAVRLRSALIIALCAVAVTARAQDTMPRVEVGPDVSLFGVPYWPIDPGGGAHVTVALTPLIAIETRVHAFREEPIPSVERGGRTIQFFSGARATFLSRGPVTVYGLLMPGLIHYSAVITDVDREKFTIGPATHFAIDMGVGASIRLHDRWSAFANLSGPLYGVGGSAHLDDFPPAAARGIMVVDVPASVQSTGQFTAGVSYRAGRLTRPIEPTHRGTWLAGGDVGVAAYAPLIATSAAVIRAPRIGGFLSFPITTWMDGDVGANVYLHTDNSHSTYEGGRISQAGVPHADGHDWRGLALQAITGGKEAVSTLVARTTWASGRFSFEISQPQPGRFQIRRGPVADSSRSTTWRPESAARSSGESHARRTRRRRR